MTLKREQNKQPPFPRLNAFLDRHDFHGAVLLACLCLLQILLFGYAKRAAFGLTLLNLSVAAVSGGYVLIVIHTILRILVGHRRVALRDILLFILSYFIIMMLFALYYGLLDALFGPLFRYEGGALDIVDFLYYSGTVQTTLGFGDIVPVHGAMKLFAILQVTLGEILLVLSIGTVIANLRPSKNAA